MENASKAIIMAGGIFIALVIISILVIMFGRIGDVYFEQEQTLSEKQMQEYNRRFSSYDRSLYGSEILSLANLISDYNMKLIDEENGTKGPLYEQNRIRVYVSFYRDITGVRDKNNKWIYKTWTQRKNVPIEEFKNYNDEIEAKLGTLSGDEYEAGKSLLTEIRSLPFVCISNESIRQEYKEKGYGNLKVVQYNKFGRISEMHFIQVLDENVSNAIR